MSDLFEHHIVGFPTRRLGKYFRVSRRVDRCTADLHLCFNVFTYKRDGFSHDMANIYCMLLLEFSCIFNLKNCQRPVSMHKSLWYIRHPLLKVSISAIQILPVLDTPLFYLSRHIEIPLPILQWIFINPFSNALCGPQTLINR